MKITEAHLSNIRGIKSLTWKLPRKQSPNGWHVILGENGAGKSSFMQALAVGLLGIERSKVLLLDYKAWLRQKTDIGSISVTIQPEESDGDTRTLGESPIMVLGVGGAGTSVVTRMCKLDKFDADLAVCDTDSQALSDAIPPIKVFVPRKTVAGESIDDLQQIRRQFQSLLSRGTKMLIIVAGLGGDTGSRIAPIIAQVSKELGILTLCVGTIPFGFENKRKRVYAAEAVKLLSDSVDSLVLIANEQIGRMYGPISIGEFWTKSDELLISIAEAFIDITRVNTQADDLGFGDVEDFLRASGPAFVTTSNKSGANRATQAIDSALKSPLLGLVDIKKAGKILLTISSGKQEELDLDELTEITETIQNNVNPEAEMIFGHGMDDSLGKSLRVTMLLTDFPKSEISKVEYLREQTDSQEAPIVVTTDGRNKSQPRNKRQPDGKASFNVGVALVRLKNGTVVSVSSESRYVPGSYKIWGDNTTGWFSAGFGPFRRITSSNAEYEKLFNSEQHKKLAAHLSLFKDNVSFTEAVTWLQNLKLRELEGEEPAGFIDLFQQFINQPGFLPHGVQMEEITSDGIFFCDANGNSISLDSLSDGFRSVLSLAFELLRQLENSSKNIFEQVSQGGKAPEIIVQASGVVLIDEIDAHLHPVWQKQIGYWFTKYFPQIQFFVTTHSPLVCQAAEHGTVFYLPRPGTSEKAGMVKGTELQRLIYGNILESYGTGVFGLTHTQSRAGQEKTNRLAELNQLAHTSKLTESQAKERDELRATLPISDSEDFVKNLLKNL